MKRTRLVFRCLFLSAIAVGLASSNGYAQSRSWMFPENNNNVIKAQRDGGVTPSTGEVKLDFFGHMAFRIITPRGTSIMIDPWRNDPSGYWGVWFPKEFPEVPVDMVLSTHAHFDHDAVYRPHASMVLERMAGEYSIGDEDHRPSGQAHVQFQGLVQVDKGGARIRPGVLPAEQPHAHG